MPSASLRYCAAPGCREKTSESRCEQHRIAQRQNHKRNVQKMPGVNYGRKWGIARRLHLAEHPFCVDCEAEGETTVATEVDHIVPHNGDYGRFWDVTNWASRCKPHHSAKTAKEVGWHRT